MKKVLAISSVLLGVVFLAGCGQQPVSQTQPTAPAPVAQTPTQPVVTTPTPTTPSNTMPADWKTYTDDASGFLIQYPITLLTEKNGLQRNDRATETIAFGKKETENFGGKQTSFVSSEVSLDVFTKPKDIQDIQNIQNIINTGKTNGNEGPKKTYEKITIGGVSALKVLGRGNTQSVDGDDVYFMKDDKAFILRFAFDANGPKTYEDNMIASFKFTR